ncbi:hypothetical protein BS17DRAFT_769697 [Gyrodon lividus]|nr:hypothetical protein BS17DRAFT_769697 [Gyrodon lividus]
MPLERVSHSSNEGNVEYSIHNVGAFTIGEVFRGQPLLLHLWGAYATVDILCCIYWRRNSLQSPCQEVLYFEDEESEKTGVIIQGPTFEVDLIITADGVKIQPRRYIPGYKNNLRSGWSKCCLWRNHKSTTTAGMAFDVSESWAFPGIIENDLKVVDTRVSRMALKEWRMVDNYDRVTIELIALCQVPVERSLRTGEKPAASKLWSSALAPFERSFRGIASGSGQIVPRDSDGRPAPHDPSRATSPTLSQPSHRFSKHSGGNLAFFKILPRHCIFSLSLSLSLGLRGDLCGISNSNVLLMIAPPGSSGAKVVTVGGGYGGLACQCIVACTSKGDVLSSGRNAGRILAQWGLPPVLLAEESRRLWSVCGHRPGLNFHNCLGELFPFNRYLERTVTTSHRVKIRGAVTKYAKSLVSKSIWARKSRALLGR